MDTGELPTPTKTKENFSTIFHASEHTTYPPHEENYGQMDSFVSKFPPSNQVEIHIHVLIKSI